MAIKNYLPKNIVARRKAGFNVPVGYWLRNDLKEMLCDLLSQESLNRQGIFEVRVVQNLVNDHLKGNKDYGFELWGLLILMVWWQLFFEGKSVDY